MLISLKYEYRGDNTAAKAFDILYRQEFRELKRKMPNTEFWLKLMDEAVVVLRKNSFEGLKESVEDCLDEK